MGQTRTWQFTVALVTAIVVFGGGTMAAIVAGQPVPEALWTIDGGLTTAIVAQTGFFTLRASGSQGMTHLRDALDTVRIVATTPPATMSIPGESPSRTGPQSSGGEQ